MVENSNLLNTCLKVFFNFGKFTQAGCFTPFEVFFYRYLCQLIFFAIFLPPVQGPASQGDVFIAEPSHPFSPSLPLMHCLYLVWMPFSQVAEHEEYCDHSVQKGHG